MEIAEKALETGQAVHMKYDSHLPCLTVNDVAEGASDDNFTPHGQKNASVVIKFSS